MATIAPEHRVVLIRIPKSAPADGDPQMLYEATRQWWRIGEQRTNGGPASPMYALAVLHGEVVAAYDIHDWTKRAADGRWGFGGQPASGDVAAYVGADVHEYFPQGAANPIRFVHCEPNADSASARDLAETIGAPERSTTDVTGEISALVKQIRLEPLAHIMFGHRELFHSNLLAWFFEALPDAADQVFGAEMTAGGSCARRQVQRERQNMDLVMTIPGRQRLVIENKVFSVYDTAQLDGYAEVVAGWDAADVDGLSTRLVLLSMLDPSKDPAWEGSTYSSEHGEWHHLSYADLAERIVDALDGAADDYAVQTMRHYAALVHGLHDLVRAVGVQSADEPVALPEETVALLGDRQLAWSLVKLRARHVAQLVDTALVKAGAVADVRSSFSNSEPVIDQFVHVVDADETSVLAGWQLQHGQWRRALILTHLAGKGAALRQQRFDYAAGHEDWFDFAVTDDVLGTTAVAVAPKTAAGETQGFNRYDPDFVYRSKKVPDITVQQLIDAALEVVRSLG